MTPLTIAQLAAAKQLPASFLAGHGVWLKDVSRGVGIPYFGETTGSKSTLKIRTHRVAKEGSRWPKGVPLQLYGLWRLEEARRAGYLILVEGESDCWTLWHHNFPALGVPGANALAAIENAPEG